MAGDGVTVALLLPDRIATVRVATLDDAAAARIGRTLAVVEAASQAQIPAGRYGDPAQFGAAAAFLCGASASIAGVALRVDGGLVGSL